MLDIVILNPMKNIREDEEYIENDAGWLLEMKRMSKKMF